MSKATKIWLIVAASLVFTGIVIVCGVMGMLKWDISKLSTVEYETNSYEINEEYNSISIDTVVSDIKFIISEDLKSSVVCYEQKNLKHSVEVKDGVLVINGTDTRKWYEHIGIFYGNPTLTVYLPEGEYSSLSIKGTTGAAEIPAALKFNNIDISVTTGDIKCMASAVESLRIKTSTGKVQVEGVTVGRMELLLTTGKVSASGVVCQGDIKIKTTTGAVSVSDTACSGRLGINVDTGKATLSNVSCESLESTGSTGDIILKNVIADNRFDIERSTGDVRFEGSDASEIYVTTDTGDVTGGLLTDKVFVPRTDTGRIDVPKTVNGGRCEITTDTGDIKIHVQG